MQTSESAASRHLVVAPASSSVLIGFSWTFLGRTVSGCLANTGSTVHGWMYSLAKLALFYLGLRRTWDLLTSRLGRS